MIRFGINLATRPFRNNLLHWAGIMLAAVALAAFTEYNARTYSQTGEEVAKWDGIREDQHAEFARLSTEVVSMTQTVTKLDLKSLNDRSSFANGIILSRLFSWSDLFDRLEKVQPENVRLRSIRPVITKEGTEVSLDALTRDYDSLLRFEASLLDSDYFSFVYPLQESSKEGQGEIRFNIAFGYIPEGKAKAAERRRNRAAPAEGGAGEPAAGPDPNAAAGAPDAGAAGKGAP
ncbi:MAG: hypothetical protein HY049_09450 [Acidobacteria bacterium]|nr:hypothetical protein [Acidobacteriota bacterium]